MREQNASKKVVNIVAVSFAGNNLFIQFSPLRELKTRRIIREKIHNL
jgi:hypothetical protein